MRKISLALSLLIVSSTALAGASKPFDGWYVGGNFGYASGTNSDVAEYSNGTNGGTPRDIDGTIGGIQAGYNWQLDNGIVLGVETGFSESSISGGKNDPSHSSWFDEIQIDNAFNLNFKAGYAIGNWLPYITTGLTYASMNYTSGCKVQPAPAYPDCGHTSVSNMDDVRLGYNIGAGVEWKFSDNFSTALEYRYTDLGKSEYTITDGSSYATWGEYETDYQEVTLRINYSF